MNNSELIDKAHGLSGKLRNMDLYYFVAKKYFDLSIVDLRFEDRMVSVVHRYTKDLEFEHNPEENPLGLLVDNEFAMLGDLIFFNDQAKKSIAFDTAGTSLRLRVFQSLAYLEISEVEDHIRRSLHWIVLRRPIQLNIDNESLIVAYPAEMG